MKDGLKEQIDECKTELTEIEQKLNTLPPLDKMKSYLTKYTLIRTCGTIEFVYRSIVADYFDKSTIPQVHTYIDKTVRDSPASAKYNNMCTLLGKFDSSWQTEFKAAVKNNPHGERMKSSVSSLVTNRHAFAHGKTPTATFQDIKQYYFDSVELINIFDSVVK
jgi:hypothetical protein